MFPSTLFYHPLVRACPISTVSARILSYICPFSSLAAQPRMQWNIHLLVSESTQAREDRKKRKELKKLAKAQAQAQAAGQPIPQAQPSTPSASRPSVQPAQTSSRPGTPGVGTGRGAVGDVGGGAVRARSSTPKPSLANSSVTAAGPASLPTPAPSQFSTSSSSSQPPLPTPQPPLHQVS